MTFRDQVEKVPQEAKTVRRNATIGLQPFVTISDTEGSAVSKALPHEADEQTDVIVGLVVLVAISAAIGVAIMGGALLCARFFVWFCS